MRRCFEKHIRLALSPAATPTNCLVHPFAALLTAPTDDSPKALKQIPQPANVSSDEKNFPHGVKREGDVTAICPRLGRRLPPI